MKIQELIHRTGKVCAAMMFSLTLALSFPAVVAGQSMTDDQVVEYIKNATAAGKSQNEIIAALSKRGVTRAQAERIKAQLESEQGSDTVSATGRAGSQESDRRHNQGDAEVTAGEMDLIATDIQAPGEVSTGMAARLVYGRDIFTNRNLSFAPSQNIPTPENYRLGPGDEIIIDVWGTNQGTFRNVISPEGYINISGLGLVYLSGMTVKEADSYMRQQLNKIYSGIADDNPTSEIKLTLGSIRTIQVNIMGDVAVPGTYTLSSFSNLFHAVYRSGGVGRLGSLRDIRLIRGGRTVSTLDVYEFIRTGTVPDGLRLEEGDVILVPPYQMLVDISGNVKRPMYYEMKEGDTVRDLIDYAGGFTADAYTSTARLVRQNGREYQVFTIDDTDFTSFKLMDGDALTIGAMLDRFENKVEVNGAVFRPGIYQLGGDNPAGGSVSTVRELVQKAEGLMEDAFPNRAVLHRQREDFTLEVVPVNIMGVMEGASEDIPLRRNDVLHIPSVHDLEDMGGITVLGEVARPGTFVYADNTTIEDIIISAGGLRESASTARVDISRRIKDSGSLEAPTEIGRTFSFAVKDGLVLDGEPGFLLEPYDQVYVRRSPAYQAQTNVTVSGEVLFGGVYALTQKSERLSDLVAKAGGVTQFAYVKGARLTRRVDAEELSRMNRIIQVAGTARDSLTLRGERLGGSYSVGIDLEAALARPGSDADIVLREGDALHVPELDNTVRISGDVLYPNTVMYEKGKKYRHYIDQAGGYAARAKKNKVYVVYMNGQVTHARRMKPGLVQPGCEIIVPVKSERNNWNIQNSLSLATTSASLASMVATIANLIK